jgi:hypothetical protein
MSHTTSASGTEFVNAWLFLPSPWLANRPPDSLTTVFRSLRSAGRRDDYFRKRSVSGLHFTMQRRSSWI